MVDSCLARQQSSRREGGSNRVPRPVFKDKAILCMSTPTDREPIMGGRRYPWRWLISIGRPSKQTVYPWGAMLIQTRYHYCQHGDGPCSLGHHTQVWPHGSLSTGATGPVQHMLNSACAGVQTDKSYTHYWQFDLNKMKYQILISIAIVDIVFTDIRK